MPDLDLTPAARHLAAVVTAVPDASLARPTPCEGMSVAALLDHVRGLTRAFTMAADKTVPDGDRPGPSADPANLDDDWRERIPVDLDALSAAWRNPAAWEGMTIAGPIEMPAPVAALVALDELVIHGWDLARATGQPFEPDEASVAAVHRFVSEFSGPRKDADREGLFGPEVPVPADAPLFHRVLGMTGRDPSWMPG